jgi:hypothetical protein
MIERSVAKTHDWLTPPAILAALGTFDLDPCASEFQPWSTAAQMFTIHDNGIAREWTGRVWCNPPYGPFAAQWLARMANHGNGIALAFARTDTDSFQKSVFGSADALLFLRGRISFLMPGGRSAGRAAAPSVLIAYGEKNQEVLRTCGLAGAFVSLAQKGVSHER